jgi:glycosyltransferase involved in cell wall biosynthesis
MSNPLITFFVCAYNQEQFIREAVEGALAQTYSPLEILLSDDCSTDRTFEIMSEMAAAYRGPHQIVLNRNQKNLRVSGHFTRAIELSHGEILVGAAGDDVSFSNRTERVHRAWVESSHRACSIYSSMIEIDASGAQKGLWNKGIPIHPTSLAEFIGSPSPGLYGFSHAFNRKVFEFFGPMDDSVVFECVAIPLRSLILGTIAYIAEPLGYYRRHGNNSWSDSSTPPTLSKRCQILRTDRAVLLTWLRDLRRASFTGILSEEESERLQTQVIERLHQLGVDSRFYSAALPGALLPLGRAFLGGMPLRHVLRLLKRRWQSQTGSGDRRTPPAKTLEYDSVGKMRRLENRPEA